MTVRKLPILVLCCFASLGSASALACGGLIGPRGSVNLIETTTLAAYHDGVEHYITSFKFAGAGGQFGSIVPLPGRPTKVERGGDWTLQRLVKETSPPAQDVALLAGAGRATSAKAQVILEATIDALDITVLKGGGDEVGVWAKDNGFTLPPDAPEVLDHYGAKSPYFMAAKFDADEAAKRGQQIGDGTPIHLTIPTDDPWVPLRILGLGKSDGELVRADVYLLTDEEPSIAQAGSDAIQLLRSDRASGGLMQDLRSDKGMDWMPDDRMWLTFIKVEATAGELDFDLEVDDSSVAPVTTVLGSASGTAGTAASAMLALAVAIAVVIIARKVDARA